jgi:magnesium-transporting ATPase (P-type)
VLVHGRWGYRRVTWFICYYFYKNIVLVFCELWFSLFNGFSGQIFFFDWLSMLYNAFWTSWPCMFTYALEQDLNAENSLKYPVVYGAG